MSPVDRDPELAAAIGRLSNNWAHTEHLLTMLFSTLTRLDLTTAAAIFQQFTSTRSQAEVLLRVAAVSPIRVSETHRKILKDTLEIYQDTARERNKIAHNPIGIFPEEQELYIMLRRKNPGIGNIPYETAPISVEAINRISASVDHCTFAFISLTTLIEQSAFGVTSHHQSITHE